MQEGADQHDDDDGDGRGAAGEHVDDGPPVQHRELVRDHVVGDLAEPACVSAANRVKDCTTITLASASCHRAGKAGLEVTRPASDRLRSG